MSGADNERTVNAHVQLKNTVCATCDLNCSVYAEVVDGELAGLRGNPAICSKALAWREYVNHPQRLLHPLKNHGKRGEQKWAEISWDQALDEIADRLQAVIGRYGPEAMVVASMPVNTGRDQGMLRRFMNVVGSPNWISGLHLCHGNTIQVNRLTVGTEPAGALDKANCIMLIGHNPHANNWTGQGLALDKALQRGAKLIVLDPKSSLNAKRADIHLRLRYGTDAAMLLGFINVIIGEGLYDKRFVERYASGFDELAGRAREYPLERVSEITGCPAGQIVEAARMYATQGPSVIPWSPIPDMHSNSTSEIRCEDILRTLCGWWNKAEMLAYPSSEVYDCSTLELHHELPEAQKRKQLGGQKFPVLSYAGYESLRGPAKRVYGIEFLDMYSSFMANPAATFKAMRTGDPYPVKALLSFGANPLMGYYNQQGAFEGMMNQDLIVTFDHWLTPTAQLSDYVLPGDHWLERPDMRSQDHMPAILMQQQVLDPPGECKNLYFVLKGLAERMGFGERFPWADVVEVMDHRLARSGRTFAEAQHLVAIPSSRPIDPLEGDRGFATPTGKIELYSTVLEELGFDPLPHYIEPNQTPLADPELARSYPLTVFCGERDAFNYITNLRQIDSLRKLSPYPEARLNPADVARYELAEGEWVWLETTHGRIQLKVRSDADQPEGTVRVPHGWWRPELEPGLETGLSGAMLHNEAMIIPDDDWNADQEQGVVNLRGGLLAKVYRVEQSELEDSLRREEEHA